MAELSWEGEITRLPLSTSWSKDLELVIVGSMVNVLCSVDSTIVWAVASLSATRIVKVNDQRKSTNWDARSYSDTHTHTHTHTRGICLTVHDLNKQPWSDRLWEPWSSEQLGISAREHLISSIDYSHPRALCDSLRFELSCSSSLLESVRRGARERERRNDLITAIAVIKVEYRTK